MIGLKLVVGRHTLKSSFLTAHPRLYKEYVFLELFVVLPSLVAKQRMNLFLTDC
jgi:hypothetical protein